MPLQLDNYDVSILKACTTTKKNIKKKLLNKKKQQKQDINK